MGVTEAEAKAALGEIAESVRDIGAALALLDEIIEDISRLRKVIAEL